MLVLKEVRYIMRVPATIVRTLTLGAVLLAAPLRAQTASVIPDSASAFSASRLTSMTTIVRDGALAGIRWPRLGLTADEFERAYTSRGWAPLWSSDGKPSPSSRAMIDALRTVGLRGLDPMDYDVERLGLLAAEGLRTADARAEFDATLSIASLRVLRALRTGRVASHESGSSTPQDSVDFVAMLGALASSAAPAEVLDAQEPKIDQYRRLKAIYATYVTYPATDSGEAAHARAIALSLERWRQLPRTMSPSQIIVNIPAFELRVLQAEGDSTVDVLAMDVVVGTAFKNQTPAFSDSVQYLVFAPYWDVPQSIARSELVDLGMRDPYLLTLNNYEIVNQKGRVLPATLASVRAVKAGTARIRQQPGGMNSLGRVKFMFPNQYDVYLHDSPAQGAFSRKRRDASHGCIRLANPEALARLLLSGQKGWDSTAVAKALALKSPLRVNLARPVPVHMLYATAVVQKDGRVVFHEDIYGRDAALASALSRGYPYEVGGEPSTGPAAKQR